MSATTLQKFTQMQSLILLDAMGGAIHHIGNVHKYVREEDLPEKTIFVITTDGQENASSEYSYEKMQKLVKRQTENESKLECRYHRAL